MTAPRIEIWTDGACKGNPGPGGWGAVVRVAGRPDVEISGYEPRTTNNRMELLGAIEGLRLMPAGAAGITVFTDSQLLVKGITEWIGGWKKRGWRKADGQPVLNAELWQALLAQVERIGQVRWQWVRGHAGVELNERADRLAVEAIERRQGRAAPGAGGAAGAAPAAVAAPAVPSVSSAVPATASPAAVAGARVAAAVAALVPNTAAPAGGAPVPVSPAEIALLLELERRVRGAVGANPGRVSIYHEVLQRLDALRTR